MFHTVVHIGEIENECILHNFIVLAILLLKINKIKIGENLT